MPTTEHFYHGKLKTLLNACILCPHFLIRFFVCLFCFLCLVVSRVIAWFFLHSDTHYLQETTKRNPVWHQAKLSNILGSTYTEKCLKILEKDQFTKLVMIQRKVQRAKFKDVFMHKWKLSITKDESIMTPLINFHLD